MKTEREFQGLAGLVEVHLDVTHFCKTGKLKYFINPVNNGDTRQHVVVNPESITPAFQIFSRDVGSGGGKGEIDELDLWRQCPKGYNSYIEGDAFGVHTTDPVPYRIDIALHERELPGFEVCTERSRSFGVVAINYCKIPPEFQAVPYEPESTEKKS